LFTVEDLDFIGDVSNVAGSALANLVVHEAMRAVFEQLCHLIARVLQGGSAFVLLFPPNLEGAAGRGKGTGDGGDGKGQERGEGDNGITDQTDSPRRKTTSRKDRLVWLCGTDEARRRLIKQEVTRYPSSGQSGHPTTTHRTHFPLFFAPVDEDRTVVHHGISYEEVAAPGPGRVGGGLSLGDVLLMQLRWNGKVVGVVGVDLFGGSGMMDSGMTSNLKASGGVGIVARLIPKESFTVENIRVAEELVQLADRGLAPIKVRSGWTVQYLDIALKQACQRLFDCRNEGMAEIKGSIRVPLKATIVIISCLFKIVDHRSNEDHLSWHGNRELFIQTNMWDRIIRFNPAKWRGDAARLNEVAKQLSALGPDNIASLCSKAFAQVYAWFDIVIVMIGRCLVQRQELERYNVRSIPGESDPESATGSFQLPGPSQN